MIDELKFYISENIITYNNRVIPNSKPSLGIKASDLKNIAKKYAEAKDYSIFSEQHNYHEEDMIHAYMIGYINDVEKAYKYTDLIVPTISNWAVCDGLVSNLKIVKKNRTFFFSLVEKYRFSSKEYEKRFSLIMLLSHYVTDEYINEIFKILDETEYDTYYVKMGAAWLLCECFIKFRDVTLNYLGTTKIDIWTFNKGIQKMIESYRVSQSDKILLKELKRVK